MWEDARATTAALGRPVAVAADGGARLVVLGEMFSTGFTMDAGRIAEGPEGPSTTFLVEAAARHGVWICGSVPLRDTDDERPANAFTIAGPDGRVVRYAKRHPFRFGGEHEHYRAGSERLIVHLGDLRVAPVVCYDLRFSDAFWPLAPDVDAYVVVASWPAARAAAWRVLCQARAIENQAWVLAVNRVGPDGNGVPHRGDSAVYDPRGEVVAHLAHQPGVVWAEVDAESVRSFRATFPAITDRRDGDDPVRAVRW